MIVALVSLVRARKTALMLQLIRIAVAQVPCALNISVTVVFAVRVLNLSRIIE